MPHWVFGGLPEAQKALWLVPSPELVGLVGVDGRLVVVVAGLEVGDEVVEVGFAVVLAAVGGDGVCVAVFVGALHVVDVDGQQHVFAVSEVGPSDEFRLLLDEGCDFGEVELTVELVCHDN